MLPCVFHKGILIMQPSTKPNTVAKLQTVLAQKGIMGKGREEERKRCAIVKQKKVVAEERQGSTEDVHECGWTGFVVTTTLDLIGPNLEEIYKS